MLQTAKIECGDGQGPNHKSGIARFGYEVVDSSPPASLEQLSVGMDAISSMKTIDSGLAVEMHQINQLEPRLSSVVISTD